MTPCCCCCVTLVTHLNYSLSFSPSLTWFQRLTSDFTSPVISPPVYQPSSCYLTSGFSPPCRTLQSVWITILLCLFITNIGWRYSGCTNSWGPEFFGSFFQPVPSVLVESIWVIQKIKKKIHLILKNQTIKPVVCCLVGRAVWVKLRGSVSGRQTDSKSVLYNVGKRSAAVWLLQMGAEGLCLPVPAALWVSRQHVLVCCLVHNIRMCCFVLCHLF